MNISNKIALYFPPHLNYVVALPWESLVASFFWNTV